MRPLLSRSCSLVRGRSNLQNADPEACTRGGTQMFRMIKTRQKLNKKLVKLTGYAYGCNILTHFENKALAMTGNRNLVNLLKLNLKNS